MADDRITLRELAQKLLLYGPYRRSPTKGRAELLQLLRNEKLTARFDFPSIERPQINLPAEYWKDTKSGAFRKALDGNSANKGDYLIAPTRFAKEYVDWFSHNHRLSEHVDELSAALRAGNTKVEVYVLAKDWEQFIIREGLDTTEHSTEVKKSNKGLTESSYWSDILVEVAVELLRAKDTSPPVMTRVAAAALSRVKRREGHEIPDTDTVTKKVKEIVKQIWPK